MPFGILFYFNKYNESILSYVGTVQKRPSLPESNIQQETKELK
jgi:hypothetical protein